MVEAPTARRWLQSVADDARRRRRTPARLGLDDVPVTRQPHRRAACIGSLDPCAASSPSSSRPVAAARARRRRAARACSTVRSPRRRSPTAAVSGGRGRSAAARVCPACSPWSAGTSSSPASSPASTSSTRRIAARERELEAGDGLTPDEHRGGQRRADRACATPCGRCATTACAPPTRSPTSPAATPGRRPIAGYLAVQQALSAHRPHGGARPRLAPACTCSCGTTVSTLADPAVAAALAAAQHAIRCSRTARCASPAPCLSFVYKAAAEIGELGDNVKALRAAIAARRAAAAGARAARRRALSVLGHTRWASVGIISEPNCHPVNSERGRAVRRRRSRRTRSPR